jgi:GT2 family glycosyltransferase
VSAELIDGLGIGILEKAFHDHQLYYRLGDEPMQVDWVTGAAMMVRKAVFEDIGLLDEGYFLYFDEVDFCFRARRAGWLAYYVPDAVAVHLQAQATGFTNGVKKRFPDYWFESRRRFYVKNRGKVRAFLADLAFLSGYATFRVRSVIQRKPNEEPPWFFFDFLRNSTLWKGFDIQRKNSSAGS